MDGRGIDDELVVRRAAGVLAGGDDERAGVAQLALAAAQGSLGELCGTEVAVNRFGGENAQLFEAIGFHSVSS